MTNRRASTHIRLLCLAISLVAMACSGTTEARLPCGWDGYEAALTVLDPTSGEIQASLDLPWPGAPGHIAAADGERIYLATQQELVARDPSGAVAWDLQWGVRRGGIRFDSAGRVLVVTGDNTLRAVDPSDGSSLWNHPLEPDTAKQVVIDGAVALVPAGKSLQAIATEDGSTMWTDDDLPRRPPRVAGGLIFGPADERNQIRAVDTVTGSERFVAEVAKRGRATHPLLAASDVVFVEELTTEPYQGGPETIQVSRLVALDTSSGRILWTAPMWGGEPNGIHLVGDNLLVSSAEDGVGVTAYEVTTGRERWSFAGLWGVQMDAVADADRYYLMERPGWSNPQRLLAVDAATGAIAWERDAGDETLHGLAVVGTAIVVTGTVDGVLQDEPGAGMAMGLDPVTGEVLWRHAFRDASEVPPMIVGAAAHALTADPPVLCEM